MNEIDLKFDLAINSKIGYFNQIIQFPLFTKFIIFLTFVRYLKIIFISTLRPHRIPINLLDKYDIN